MCVCVGGSKSKKEDLMCKQTSTSGLFKVILCVIIHRLRWCMNGQKDLVNVYNLNLILKPNIPQHHIYTLAIHKLTPS